MNAKATIFKLKCHHQDISICFQLLFIRRTRDCGCGMPLRHLQHKNVNKNRCFCKVYQFTETNLSPPKSQTWRPCFKTSVKHNTFALIINSLAISWNTFWARAWKTILWPQPPGPLGQPPYKISFSQKYDKNLWFLIHFSRST